MHQIGVGVLGPVFRTYEPSADRLVAVKAFHLDITPEQARTLIEALERLLSIGPVHPGIVAPLAAGLEDDAPYLAQEYVAAESLDVAIRHYAPASIETAMPFISQMAAAIDAAHKGGVLHGALHLRDIFVSPDEVRVTGFGIVTALEEIGLAGPIRRPYTAPEIIAGRGWGEAADRFALAAIAYELLTGRRAAGTGDQVTERIRSIEGVADPEHLEEVFVTALADDPEDRYSTAARFVSALESGAGAESGDAVGVEPEPEIELNLENAQEKFDQEAQETAPLDLLAGLELHPEDSGVDPTLDPTDQPTDHVTDQALDQPMDQTIDQAIDRLESTGGEADEDIVPQDQPEDQPQAQLQDQSQPQGQMDEPFMTSDDRSGIAGLDLDEAVRPDEEGIEPRVSATDLDDEVSEVQTGGEEGWSTEGTTDFGVDAIDMEADEAADLEVREPAGFRFEDSADRDTDSGRVDPDDDDTDDLAVSDTVEGRYVPDIPGDDEEEADFDSIPGLPPPEEAPRSVWSRGIVSVLAIALIVGGLAYVLGVALAPDQGPTDQVLESQSASLSSENSEESGDSGYSANTADRELSAELVAGTGDPPASGAAGGAPATAPEPVGPSAVASSAVETDSGELDVAQPSPEPTAVSGSPAAAPETARPGTRTVRVPAPESAAIGEPSSPAVASATPPNQPEADAPTGWVLIRTDPPGATVILDGVGRGETPLSLRDVAFGTHRLEVSRAGFGTVQRDVTVSEQDTVVPVGVTLSRASQPDQAVGAAETTGSLAVRSRPPGARVTVDGTPAGVTPLVVALPVGRYQVQILGDGYQTWATSVEVTSAERAQVRASLERLAR